MSASRRRKLEVAKLDETKALRALAYLAILGTGTGRVTLTEKNLADHDVVANSKRLKAAYQPELERWIFWLEEPKKKRST